MNLWNAGAGFGNFEFVDGKNVKLVDTRQTEIVK